LLTHHTNCSTEYNYSAHLHPVEKHCSECQLVYFNIEIETGITKIHLVKIQAITYFPSVKYISRAKRTVWSVVINRAQPSGCTGSGNSSVGVVIRLRAERSWNSGAIRSSSSNKRFFSFPKCRNGLWGPPSFLVNGHSGIFRLVKHPGPEAGHSPNLMPRYRL
jgi:hypothetical protein